MGIFFFYPLSMRSREKEFEFVLDFILNKATPQELEGIEMALHRRRQVTPSLKDLSTKIESMAKDMANKITRSYQLDTKKLAKRIITQIILQHEPNISEEHLEKLLEYYVPDEKTNIPKELLYTMVEHFIDYSLGRMPRELIEELKQTAPNWYEKYWNVFPLHIKTHIADFLKGKMSSDEFWRELKKML